MIDVSAFSPFIGLMYDGFTKTAIKTACRGRQYRVIGPQGLSFRDAVVGPVINVHINEGSVITMFSSGIPACNTSSLKTNDS